MNTESQVLNVPIEDIIPNRFQPRLNFDDEALKELAASIKEHGIIQPLVLRRLGEKYEIVAGERRYKAAKMAGLMSVPAIISTLDDKQSAEVAIVENVQRKDLTSIEEARSYKALLDKGYLTQDELAKKMGLSQSAISNKLRLLSLSDNVQNALMEGKISERHARSLLKVTNFQEQDEWLKKIIEERLTVKDLDNKLKDIVKTETKSEETPLKVDETPINNDTVLEEKASDTMEEINKPIINTNPVLNNNDEKPIPNKFFNFLEDEEVNMNTTEEKKEEEIELLDFIAPENNEKDYKEIDEKIDILINELNSSYKASLDKKDEDGKRQYIITIE